VFAKCTSSSLYISKLTLNLCAVYSGSPDVLTETFKASHEILVSGTFLKCKNYVKFKTESKGCSVMCGTNIEAPLCILLSYLEISC
jgi:hypothetical protein